jgi:hypothetical protein
MTVAEAYTQGVYAARACFKQANALGADAGVAPKGPEWSHGTARTQYAERGREHAHGSEDAANMPDWLWDHFTSYDDDMAPGRADGSYSQEVIG